jgi:hypothetical protein
VVGLAATPDGQGYWEAAADGGVFAFGDAGFYGSIGGQHLNAAVVGLAPTPDGQGYWEAAADGGIFGYGDAGFYGSHGGAPGLGPVTAEQLQIAENLQARQGWGAWPVSSRLCGV